MDKIGTNCTVVALAQKDKCDKPFLIHSLYIALKH